QLPQLRHPVRDGGDLHRRHEHDPPAASLSRPPGGGRVKIHEQDVLRQVAAVLAPLIVTFGLYVITHGEGGAGAGSQGGVMIAAAYILYALINGQEAPRRALPPRFTDLGAPLGVLIYAGVGVVSMLRGGPFLAYDLLDPAFQAGQAGH